MLLPSWPQAVVGSRTFEPALGFEAKGLGWAHGDKLAFVLTSRALPRHSASVALPSHDLTRFVNERLHPTFRSIWFAGGGAVAGASLRRGWVDEVRR